MANPKGVSSAETAADTDKLVADYLQDNPEIAAALATFDIAQDEYRRSLLALTSVQVATSGSANVEL